MERRAGFEINGYFFRQLYQGRWSEREAGIEGLISIAESVRLSHFRVVVAQPVKTNGVDWIVLRFIQVGERWAPIGRAFMPC